MASLDKAGNTHSFSVDDSDSKNRASSSNPNLGNTATTLRELSTTSAIKIGSLFAERYTILTQLGTGGMSVVFLARHETLGKRVAVKTLQTHLVQQNVALLRFKNEAKAASMLDHPAIVSTFDYGVDGEGTPYLVMDYVEGTTLSSMLEEEKTLHPKTAIEIFLQATAGLAHAHSKGIVHRDLKPSNLMLCGPENKRQVKIVDFGVAKIVADSEVSKLTQTGEAIGSPLYMSPEQCLGQAVDHRSDIYSLGVLMYEALTGVQPFATESVFGTIMKHINELPPSFKMVNPALESESALEKIVFKALAKDPNKRYQSMAELRDDLQSLNSGKGFSAVKRLGDQLELWHMKAGRSIRFVILLAALAFFISIWGGMTFGVMMLPRIAAMPSLEELKKEPAPWALFQDKPIPGSRTRTASSMRPIVDKIMDHLVEYQKFTQPGAAKNIDSLVLLSKEAREQHNYADCVAICKDLIDALKKLAREEYNQGGVLNIETFTKLYQAYERQGEAYYYQGIYGLAAKSFENENKVVDEYRRMNTTLPMKFEDYLLARIKLMDCYYFNGKYDDVLRVMQDGDFRGAWVHFNASSSLLAFYNSKLAETQLRLGHFEQAHKKYKTALNEWKKSVSDNASDDTSGSEQRSFLKESENDSDSDSGTTSGGKSEQSLHDILTSNNAELGLNLLLCTGKYGEVLQYQHDPKAASYLKMVWDELGMVHTNDDKLQLQLSHILQCYANNLWNRGQLWDAWLVHQKAEAIKPRL